MTDLPTLIVHERRSAILRALSSEEQLSVCSLSKRFGVSEVTIRGDLAALAERNLIVRVHGGARIAALGSGIMADHRIRRSIRAEQKRRIGATAASMIQDGEAIILDSSTTALAIVGHLRGYRDLTVATYGLTTAGALSEIPGINVFMIGGFLRRSLSAFFGDEVDLEGIKRFNFQKAFFGAIGFTLEEGLTDSWPPEVRVKKQIAACARQVYAVVDSSKWGMLGFVSFVPVDHIHCVITDEEASPDMVTAVRNAGIDVMIA